VQDFPQSLEDAVKYVILIHSNRMSQEVWEQMPAEERSAGLAAYAALNADLEASGEVIASEALALPPLSKTITVRDDVVLSTDGPFAEAKEYLAGFFLVDVADQQRAVEIAARIPEARFGNVEVRPVMDLSAFEF
jgi:hypothetical protein